MFALAHALDARGDYARAADCLRQANAMTLELRQGQREYVPAEHEKFVDTIVHPSIPNFSPACPAPAPKRAGRCLSSACRARARR